MKGVESLPAGTVTLVCPSCGAVYAYWNGSPSIASRPDPPRCVCGETRYTRQYGSPMATVGWDGRLTPSAARRVRGLQIEASYETGEQLPYQEVAREFGKYLGNRS